MMRFGFALTVVSCALTPLVWGDVTVQFANPGAQTSSFTTQSSSADATTFSFDNLQTGVNSNVVWTGNGGSMVGTFSGLNVRNWDQYGGASETKYGFAGPTPVSSAAPGSNTVSTTLALTHATSYFGFWWSAADVGNSLTLYDGSKAVETLTYSSILSALGNCNGGTNRYCGNVNNGADRTELFSYVNIFAAAGTDFTSVTFENTGTSNFEFDNITVLAPPGCDPVAPEPSTLAFGVLGLLSGVGIWRVRKSRTSANQTS